MPSRSGWSRTPGAPGGPTTGRSSASPGGPGRRSGWTRPTAGCPARPSGWPWRWPRRSGRWRAGRTGGPAPAVALRHWAAAQEVAERWRHDAHAVLAAALRDEDGDATAVAAARLVAALGQAGGRLARREALRRLRCTTAQLDGALRAAEGRVRERRTTTGGRPAEWLELTRPDASQPARGAQEPASAPVPATATDDADAGAEVAAESGGRTDVTAVTKGTKADHQDWEGPPLVTSGVTKAGFSASDDELVGTGAGRANGHAGEPDVEVLEL